MKEGKKEFSDCTSLQCKRAQVWIETVMYTLIALVLIGAVLTFVKPKIEEIQDKNVIEQSLVMLKDIDSIISEVVQAGEGNKRKVELSVKEGTLSFDGVRDAIIFDMESKYQPSEIGQNISEGNVKMLTAKTSGKMIVLLYLDYRANRNLTFEGEDKVKSLAKSSTPYTIFISNKGRNAEDKNLIDIEI